jgi:hypothetical protein
MEVAGVPPVASPNAFGSTLMGAALVPLPTNTQILSVPISGHGEPFMSQAVAQRNNKQANENEMHKKQMVYIAKNEKENKARLVVAWQEAHKPSAIAQAQKTRK